MLRRTLIVLFALAVNIPAGTDTTAYRFYLGYENGLSFRIFFQKKLGAGIIIQPAGIQMLYGDSESERTVTSTSREYEFNEKTKSKGATILADFQYRKKIGKRFSLTPFVSIGGRYIASRYVYSYIHTVLNDSMPDYSDVSSSEEITRAFISQIGILPGLEYGPFSIQFRLGIRGRVSRSESPENVNSSYSSKSQNLELIYPADIVKSIIVHIGF